MNALKTTTAASAIFLAGCAGDSLTVDRNVMTAAGGVLGYGLGQIAVADSDNSTVRSAVPKITGALGAAAGYALGPDCTVESSLRRSAVRDDYTGRTRGSTSQSYEEDCSRPSYGGVRGGAQPIFRDATDHNLPKRLVIAPGTGMEPFGLKEAPVLKPIS